jgi:hypothetical protein
VDVDSKKIIGVTRFCLALARRIDVSLANGGVTYDQIRYGVVRPHYRSFNLL